MKLQEECVECSAKRAGRLLEGKAQEKGIRFIVEIVRASAKKNIGKKSPVIQAKERTELIAKKLGMLDVSREKKDSGIRIAKRIVRDLELPKGGFARFEKLVRVAIAANSLELDLPGHSAEVGELEKRFREEVGAPLGLDESEEIYERVLSSKKILYLCDNAPELVFDLLLIKFLRSLGKKVTPVVRGRFTQDDATQREARMLGLKGYITTGSSATGVVYLDATKKLQRLLRASDLIISKGMGNFEGLTEDPWLIKNKTAFLFKVKCVPVAREIGVPMGSGAAFICR